MKDLTTAIQQFLRDEEGLTTVEYAITGALVVLLAATTFTSMQNAVVERIDFLSGVLASNGIDGKTLDCSSSIADC